MRPILIVFIPAATVPLDLRKQGKEREAIEAMQSYRVIVLSRCSRRRGARGSNHQKNLFRGNPHKVRRLPVIDAYHGIWRYLTTELTG